MANSNCPNCNAILSYEGGLHCDYCGARFERPKREQPWDYNAFYADDNVYYVAMKSWDGSPVRCETGLA